MRRDPCVAPFALDTWPLCEPWERAGRVTPCDLAQLAGWIERCRLEIALDVDRRFDELADRIAATAWSGVE